MFPRVQIIGDPFSFAEVYTPEQVFKFEDAIDAIDFCYLTYIMIGIDFPETGKDCWRILSEVVYDVKCKGPLTTESATIIADLVDI
jgi:hypothetical protein